MIRVLVIDDSPIQLANQQKILRAAGYETLTANGGALGIELAQSEQPDLILMDVVMPDINGFQATRQLHRNPATREIPVIMVTTKDQQTDKVWAKRQGAAGYVVKPVQAKLLLKEIDQVLLERQQQAKPNQA